MLFHSRLYCYLFLAICFVPKICFGTDVVKPVQNDLYGGQVFLELDKTNPNGDEKNISFPQQMANIFQLVRYFNDNYPGDKIFEDFSAELKDFFPQADDNTLKRYMTNIRDVIRLYRYGKNWYDKIKQSLVIPEDTTPVYADSAYERPENRPYIESDDLVVINDFKKVVSYSSLPKDFKAYQAKYQHDLEEKRNQDDSYVVMTPEKRLTELFSRLDFKNFFLKGDDNTTPLWQEVSGVSPWLKKNDVLLRLEVEKSALNDEKHLKGAVHVFIPPKHILNLEKGQRPVVEFKAENLENFKVFNPIFSRFKFEGKEFIGVVGNVALPFELSVKNPKLPLKLKSSISLNICNIENECQKYAFSPSFEVDAGIGFATSSSNFITQAFLNLPKVKNDDVKVLSLSYDDDKHELRLRLKGDVNPTKLDVLLESDKDIRLSSPRIAVDGDYVDVFWNIEENVQSLLGEKFVAYIKFDTNKSIKTSLEVQSVPQFEILGDTFTLALLLAAFAGGFILNFMPCVFPVLALKLLMVTRFGGYQRSLVRQGFFASALGIVVAFVILAFVLSSLKALGISLGWGMQFQSVGFLLFMLFSLMLFLAYIGGIFSFKFPSFLSKGKVFSANNWGAFVVGILIVLFATPCSAPYLATAVGFALTSSSYLYIFLIFFMISLGLALPYILVAVYPDIVKLLPKPGAWMKKVETFMAFMLFLTLVWLLSVLGAQLSFWGVFRIVVYLLLFLLLLLYFSSFMAAADRERLSDDLRKKIKLIWRGVFYSLFLVLFVVSYIDVSIHFSQNRELTKHTSIDENQISELVKQGKNVIVAVDSDWCLTCKFNDVTVFNSTQIENMLSSDNVVFMRLNWNNYDIHILDFMKKYGRSAIPFYVFFNKKIPQGIVLPEVLTEKDFRAFLREFMI